MNTDVKQVSCTPEHRIPGAVARAGYFFLHFVEMCLAMCVGGLTLNVFFWVAAQLGYPDRIGRFLLGLLLGGRLYDVVEQIGRFPEFSLLAIGISLALPMAAWMRFRGHEWRPTLEMASTSIILVIMLIGASWLGFLPKSSTVKLLCTLACPLMLVPMLLRLDLYTGHHADHSHHAHAANPADET